MANDFDEAAAYAEGERRGLTAQTFEDGARYQHSLMQERLDRTEAQNIRLREMAELEEVKRLRAENAQLSATCERMRLALERIAKKCKDNYWAAIADDALRPKEVVLSAEALESGERKEV